MTIQSQTNKETALGDDSTVQFFYTFRVDNDSDMHPFLDEIEQTSGFTVNRNPDNVGGDVTFDTPPVLDVIVTLLRDVPLSQETDYTAYDSFPAESHELALDKLTMQTQQIEEEVGRATKAPITDDGTTDYTLPAYDPGKGIMWDEIDKKMVNSDSELNGIIDEAQNWADASAASASESAGHASSSAGFANDSQLKAWDAEAEELTANSYAVEPEDTFVKIYTSDGDGTFTATPTTDYSALHYAAKSGGTAIWVSDTPPTDKLTFPHWFNSATGKTFTWYGDIDSGQWVQDVAQGEGNLFADNSVGEQQLDVDGLQVAGLLPTAWCTFDGTLTGTNAPIDGLNIASVTRTSLGQYTITFSEDMDNTNYGVVVSGTESTNVYTLNVSPFRSAVSVGEAPLVGSFKVHASIPAVANDSDGNPITMLIYGGKI